MLLATKSDFEKVKETFYLHKKWFPHIRTDYMMRRIEANQCVFEDGIVITFHNTKVRQKIGNVRLEKGDTVLHQIANSQPGSGMAPVVLKNFFDWCEKNVYLSVRTDNTVARAFYDKVGMKEVGTCSWAKGTLPGVVYVRYKQSDRTSLY